MEYNRKIELTARNLAILREREDICSEQMDISLRQMAAQLGEEGDGGDAGSVYMRYCVASGAASAKEKAIVCRYLCENAKFSPHVLESLPFGDTEQLSASARGTVAYVSNMYTDKIAAQLSDSKHMKKRAVSTMLEACEAVWESSCEFCIIPIENETDGKLYSFYSMMDRFDLKICEVIAQSQDDGAGKTYFALAGKRINAKTIKKSNMRLEFSVVSEGENVISELVLAADAFGARISCIGTQPLPYGDEGNRYYFTVDFDRSSPLPLVAYFSFEHIRYSLIGLYPRK